MVNNITNMKNQSNSFSLLSIIDKLTKPNLNEVELNETNPVAVEDAIATLKNLGKFSKAAAQDIVTSMNKGGQAGEAIHIIKNNNLFAVTTGDELITALKAGTIDAVNLARVNKGILKSGAVTDQTILRNIASDVVIESGFISKYGVEYLANGENAARKLLQDNGYTRNAIDEMIKKMKNIPNYGKDVVGLDKEIAKLKSQNKILKGKIKKLNQQGQPIEVVAITDGNNIVKPTQDGGLQIIEPVPAGGTPSTPINVPPNKIKELITGIKSGWNWKKALAWGAAISLGATAVWWAICTSSDTIPNDMPLQEPPVGGKWEPCIQELLTSKEGQMGRDGSVVVKPTDFPGGLQFYNNGRVMDVVGKKMGTWKCKGTKTVIAETQKISLIGLLNEQGGEIDEKTFTDYVNNAITDLDGFVDMENLTNVSNILKNLNGKTFGGKNAISEFLSYYKKQEGEEFIDDVNSVGTKSLGTLAVVAKDRIIAFAKNGGTTATPKSNTGGNKGLGGIDIIWDGQKKEGEKVTTPVKKSKYHDCSGKDTFEFGCRAPKIKEIQKCLGMEERYQTGNFGPLTKKALEDMSYDTSQGITVEMYNRIKSTCTGKSDVDNSDVRAPKLDNAKIEPLKTNKTPVAPVNVGNMKLPNIQPVGQGNKGEKIYNLLKGNFDTRNEAGNEGDSYIFQEGNRIKYKGNALSQENLDMLTSYISELGYDFMKAKPKDDYEFKYVWLKR